MLLNHNIDVYNQLCSVLSEHNCCCVIMGTGVGKSYVTLEYIKEHNLKALIVTPRLSINNSWNNLCCDLVDTITYSKLSRIYKDIDFTKYDVVVCDEVHHIGALKWGAPIKHLIDDNIIKVIGLTECSVRYTDGARDVAQEFFNNNVAIGEDVSSAIKNKILNPVTYVGAMYNSDGLKKTLRGKIQSRLYAKLNLVLNNTPTVLEIVKKTMPEGKRKGIIFASTIDDIDYAINFMHAIYPDAVIKFVHSKRSSSLNDKDMEWFKNTDEGYICSVDMISEGVHIKGVNTLIMLRRTESPNVFNQQLGRCLDANSNEPAVLFDLVNNKYNVKIVNNKLRIKINTLFNSSILNTAPSEQLIVKDYTKDIITVLQEIKESLFSSWTDEEIDILKVNYNKVSIQTLLTLLPKRTFWAIKTKARDLSLSGLNNWGDKEIQLLKDNYYKLPFSKLCSLFPNRTKSAISSYASRIGLSNAATWSDDEIAIIKKYYLQEGSKIASRLPNRALASIYAKAAELGFVRSSRWTPEEDAIIYKYYSVEGGRKVSSMLPGRTYESVLYRAKLLGVKKLK